MTYRKKAIAFSFKGNSIAWATEIRFDFSSASNIRCDREAPQHLKSGKRN
jgi:hypothetical protein